MGKPFSDRVENIVGKEEIARYEQFLLFSQCFRKLSVVDALKRVFMAQRVNHLVSFCFSAVAIFIAMKYRKSKSNKKQNSHCEMVYSAVMDCEDTRDMDNVNILPRA